MQSSAARLTTINLNKEYMKFSAAHFTIFSKTERERLHGHNFNVEVEIKTTAVENGITFNYRLLKDIVSELCDELDEYLLIPANSKFLSIQEDGDYYRITFNNKDMLQLRDETKLLPIENSTVEEYSAYILNRLHEKMFSIPCSVHYLKVGVSSGPGQVGYTEWQAQ